MKINKESLHYKFNKFFGEPMPKTLCGYFWFTVFNIFRVVTITGLTVLGSTVILSPVLKHYINTPEMRDLSYFGLLINELITAVVIITVACLLFGKASFGRIIFEYVKAFKNKVCPLIEYEGTQDDSTSIDS